MCNFRSLELSRSPSFFRDPCGTMLMVGMTGLRPGAVKGKVISFSPFLSFSSLLLFSLDFVGSFGESTKVGSFTTGGVSEV